MEIKLIFEPRDLWIGVFVDGWDSDSFTKWLTIYITIIPMLPIRLRWFQDKPLNEIVRS